MRTADCFGAKVSLALPGQGMFLLVAMEAAGLEPLVRSVGGRVVARLDACRALVVMGLAAYLGLRGARAVRFIGPVSVDQQRLAAVLGVKRTPPVVS